MSKYLPNEVIEKNIYNLSLKYEKLSRKQLQQLYNNGELICILETLTKKFGSIKKILNKYNIVYYREYSKLNIKKEDIIDNIKQLSIKYKKLSITDLKQLHKNKELICQPNTIKNKCGNIQKVLNKYGIKLYEKKHYNDKKYNKQKIIEILSKLPKDKTYNSQVFYQLYNDGVIPFKYHYIGRHLGKIKNACNICGLKYKKYEYAKDFVKGKSYSEIYSKDKINKIIYKWSKSRNKEYGCGQNENKILNYIQNNINEKIIKSYWVYTNNLRLYKIDGYINDINLCLEVDEKYHYTNYQNKLDKIREEDINNTMNCIFIRINEQEWIKNKYYRYFIVDIIKNYIDKKSNKLEKI